MSIETQTFVSSIIVLAIVDYCTIQMILDDNKYHEHLMMLMSIWKNMNLLEQSISIFAIAFFFLPIISVNIVFGKIKKLFVK